MIQTPIVNMMLNINKPTEFTAWSNSMWLNLGQKACGGGLVTLYRKGHMHEEAFSFGLADTMTMVAPGSTYRGVIYPTGLTAAQARIIFPVGPVAATISAKREGYRNELLKNAGGCIASILSQMIRRNFTLTL